MCAEKASSSIHFLFCHVPFQHMPCFIMYRFNTCPVLSCTDSSHALLCNVPFCHMYHFVHVLIELLYLCPMGSSPSYEKPPPLPPPSPPPPPSYLLPCFSLTRWRVSLAWICMYSSHLGSGTRLLFTSPCPSYCQKLSNKTFIKAILKELISQYFRC